MKKNGLDIQWHMSTIQKEAREMINSFGLEYSLTTALSCYTRNKEQMRYRVAEFWGEVYTELNYIKHNLVTP